MKGICRAILPLCSYLGICGGISAAGFIGMERMIEGMEKRKREEMYSSRVRKVNSSKIRVVKK